MEVRVASHGHALRAGPRGTARRDGRQMSDRARRTVTSSFAVASGASITRGRPEGCSVRSHDFSFTFWWRPPRAALPARSTRLRRSARLPAAGPPDRREVVSERNHPGDRQDDAQTQHAQHCRRVAATSRRRRLIIGSRPSPHESQRFERRVGHGTRTDCRPRTSLTRQLSVRSTPRDCLPSTSRLVLADTGRRRRLRATDASSTTSTSYGPPCQLRLKSVTSLT